MSRLKGFSAQLRDVFRGSDAEARMEEEFEFHLDMETRKLVGEGLSPSEARRRALITFGGLDAQRETMRDERGARWFHDLGADVRYAFNGMRRSPGFAIAVALTLGIGIGVNGAIFGYVNSILLRPLPARNADELVGLFQRETRSGDVRSVGYDDYVDFRDRSGAFASLAGVVAAPINMTPASGGDTGTMIWGEMVTEDFFSVLDMRPAAGRFFTAADAPRGANAFVVLSHESWSKRFGADPAINGKTVRLNGRVFTITGVAPPWFRGLRLLGFWPEMWVPIGMHEVIQRGSSECCKDGGGGSLMLGGRTKSDFDGDRTQAAAERFAARLG